MKRTTLLKGLINTMANIGIFGFGLQLLASLTIFLANINLSAILPEGAVINFSAYDSLIGANLYTLLMMLSNSLMIYGLLLVKDFVKTFKKADLFEATTIAFLRKSSVLLALVGIMEAVMTATHHSFYLNLRGAGVLLLASFVLAYVKKEFKPEA